MPNYTPNLNLVKPLVTEQYDIAKVTNENADKIDLLLAPKANPTFTGLTELPLTTTLGGQDIRTLLMPKNWIINGMFDVWQRGILQTTNGYGSDDRWTNGNNGSTKIHSRQAFTVGQTEVPNNPKYFSRTIVSSVVGADNWVYKQQWIEDVAKLAGKTITLSFWAKADANKNIAVEFRQYFGTGGSEIVNEIGVQKFSLTTSWQKITKTVTLPSVSGKTIGDGSAIIAQFWFDAGTNSNSRTNNLGHQSGTFDIANVSLVEGSVAVECQNQPYADVLEQCRWYYRKHIASMAYGFFGSGIGQNTTSASLKLTLGTPMRVRPTLDGYSNLGLTNGVDAIFPITSLVIDLNATTPEIIAFNSTSSGLTAKQYYDVIGNNSTSAYIAFNAEL